MFRLKELYRKIKYAWQRAIRGYDDSMVWNLYAWFLEYIPKILRDLNSGKYGHPSDMTEEEWNKILNKMIDCFEEACESTCKKVNKYQEAYDHMWDDFTEQKGLFGADMVQPEECAKEGTVRLYMPGDEEVGRKDWGKISDNYIAEERKIADYRGEKLKEGLDLFKEYFWDLWD